MYLKKRKNRSVSVLKNDSNYRKELFTGARCIIRNIHGYGTVKTKSLKVLFIVLNSLIILNNVIPRCTMLKINNTRRTLKTIHGPYTLLFTRNIIINQIYFINKNARINTRKKGKYTETCM